MDLQLSLFGGVYLTTSWGRIDGAHQQKRDYWFDDEREAFKKARTILKTRQRHKYQILEEV
jgi:predicted DNA-binding WGR domain protein